MPLGWQTGCWRLFNGTRGHEGGIKVEIEVGLFANGAPVIALGKKKVKALGTGVMRDVAESVEGDDGMREDRLKAHGALAVGGTMMAAGSGGVIIIK